MCILSIKVSIRKKVWKLIEWSSYMGALFLRIYVYKYIFIYSAVLGLLSNVATIILGCIFSMLLSDFRGRGPRGIPKSPMTALMEFFYAHAEINAHPLPVSRYFISSSLSYVCPWCNRYRRRNWTRRHEFKSWTRLIAFHIALIPLGKVWIQLFSLQLWVNSRTD